MIEENKTSVMLVDDDKDICTIMRSGLQRHGFNVTTFNDPLKALSQLGSKRYDKIVLDLRMPEMNGIQLAKQIWAKDPDARICFFSAYDMYEREAKAEFSSLTHVFFIEKPITPTELARRINENLQNYK